MDRSTIQCVFRISSDPASTATAQTPLPLWRFGPSTAAGTLRAILRAFGIVVNPDFVGADP